MKFEIKGDVLALCQIDMDKFKSILKQDLNLKESIKRSLEVINKGHFKEESLFKYVWLGVDWGRILDYINDNKDNKMVIRFFKCEYSDKVEFIPDCVSEDGRTFLFQIITKNGYDVMMINSFVSSPDFNIKSFLNMTTFNYGKVRWKPLLE